MVAALDLRTGTTEDLEWEKDQHSIHMKFTAETDS